MDIGQYCELINKIKESKYINPKEERIAYGFAVCIVAQLLYENKDPGQNLKEICEKAKLIAPGEDKLEQNKRKEIIDELREFEEKLELNEPPVSLLCGDTDKVKSYVFESTKLPEVRGASIILDKLNRNLIKKEIFTKSVLKKECLIYNSGGGIMAVVPTFLKEKVCEKIERLYLSQTSVATITVIAEPFHLYEYRFGLHANQFNSSEFEKKWGAAEKMQKRMMVQYYGLKDEKVDTEELQDAFSETKGFGELVIQMTYKLQKAKRNKPFSPKIESGKFLRNCTSCEFRAAVHEEPFEDEIYYLCEVCKQKRDKGRKEKGGIVNKYIIEYFEDNPGNREKYFTELQTEKKMKIAPPKDLREIGKCSFPEGFIGMIYADGDNVGKTLESLQTPSRYQEFSKEMDEVSRDAVFEAIIEREIEPRQISEEEKEKYEKDRTQLVYKKKDGTLSTRSVKDSEKKLNLYIHTFELVSAGGDDLVLFVPADEALWTAYDICKNFSKRMSNTMSAGVIIASDHYPVYYLFDLASQLLKSAKKESHDAEEGAIDFMVLGSQNTLSSQIEDYRKSFLEKEVEQDSELKERLYLKERPYKLSKLKKLLDEVERFKKKNYPTSQLYGLVEALNQHSRQHSTLRFLYQLSRHKRMHKELLQEFVCNWNISQTYTPWTKLERSMPFDEFSSVFVDMLEIYKFV